MTCPAARRCVDTAGERSPMIYDCPSCGKKLKIPDELVGTTVRCQDCAATFVAATAPPPPPSRAVARPPDDLHDDDIRPSRRRRGDTRTETHRGGMVMAFGIISLVLVLLSGGVYVCGLAAGPVALGGIPVTIIGLVLGILAWKWGSLDLKRMKAGSMDPSGQGMTQAGYICGIIGTILHALGLVAGCIAAIMFLIIGAAFLSCCMFSAANAPPPGQTPFPPPPPPRKPPFSMQPLKLSDYLLLAVHARSASQSLRVAANQDASRLTN